MNSFGCTGTFCRGAATVGSFLLTRGALGEGAAATEDAAWAAPSMLARVIPGEGPFPTLGLPGDADVFVTDASAIQGMNAAQLSQFLDIPASDSYTVVEFGTPSEGLASPVFRTNPGFIQGGFTNGGAPEFVIPNGPIPAGAITRIVGP